MEAKVIVLLGHVVEGRCGVRMPVLVTECDRFLQDYCPFLDQFKDLMRNSEFLILSMAHEVSYLKTKKLPETQMTVQFADEVVAEFKCWEVRPEFLEAFKAPEVKRVRQCRESTAQKMQVYQNLILLCRDLKNQNQVDMVEILQKKLAEIYNRDSTLILKT